MGGIISSIDAVRDLPPDRQNYIIKSGSSLADIPKLTGGFGKFGLPRNVMYAARAVVEPPQAVQNVEAASRDSRGYADRPPVLQISPPTSLDVLPSDMRWGRKRGRRHAGII